MLKYLRTLYAIVASAAARLGRLRLCWIVGFGIGARLSVLFTFMLVVQLAVHTLKQVGFHLPYPLSEIKFDSHFVLPLSFLVVPALFYFAGWTMVHAQKIAAQFVSDFVFETRRSNVKASAHTLLMNGDYPGAQGAFAAYLKKYPKGSKASDAQYFIGESLLYQDDYPNAAAAYGKLIKDYPNAAKGPDGLVKLARALRLMDKKTDACKTLDLMSKQFPKASATAKQLASTERQRAGCKA